MEQSESFQQLSDILQIVKGAHGSVRSGCDKHVSGFSSQQKELLVTIVREDQRCLESALEHYLKRSCCSEETSTWVQYVPQEELKSAADKILSLKAPTFEQLVAAISEVYRAIETFMQRIHEQVSSDAAMEVMEDLQFLERQKARLLSERVNGLNDI